MLTDDAGAAGGKGAATAVLETSRDNAETWATLDCGDTVAEFHGAGFSIAAAVVVTQCQQPSAPRAR